MISALHNTLTRAAELEPMHDRQRLVAVIGCVAVVIIVFELVRRRKLREEYSWVWIATAAAVCLLALSPSLLLTITGWIGAASSASTLFFGAIVFLLALCIQFSIRLSRLTHRQRTLAQRMALMEEEMRTLRRQQPDQQTKRRTKASEQEEVA